jgi:voltage-gated potassium channel
VGRLNVLERRLARFLREPPSIRAAAGVIVTATVIVVVGAGVLISILDREEYPTVWLGMWVSLQTVTTVGYGDVAPTRLGGRVVAAAVMLYGVAFVAIVTAAITSTFVARATEQHEAERLHGGVSDRELIERRFDELERKLDALAAMRTPPGS